MHRRGRAVAADPSPARAPVSNPLLAFFDRNLRSDYYRRLAGLPPLHEPTPVAADCSSDH